MKEEDGPAFTSSARQAGQAQGDESGHMKCRAAGNGGLGSPDSQSVTAREPAEQVPPGEPAGSPEVPGSKATGT